MNKIIVFGACHHNTLGLIRSIGEKGFAVIVILTFDESVDCYIAHSKYVSKMHYINKEEEVILLLKAYYWNEVEMPFILCSSDAAISILDNHYSELKDHFRLFNINTKEGAINYYLNKDNTFLIARESGLQTIKTWHFLDKEGCPKDISYPCLVKHNNSIDGPKTDMGVCQNEDELLGHIEKGKDYLVQEYIEKDYELNIIGVSFNHGKNVVIPGAIRKIRDYLHFQSMYMRLDSLKDYPSLDIDAIKCFLFNLGYEGLFSVELLCRENTYYFLEVNLRNDGCGYLYTAAGVNMPYLWVKYANTDMPSIPLDNLSCRTPFYLMNDFDIYNVRYGRVSLLTWIHDLFKSDVFFIFQIKDIQPFCCIISSMIRKIPSKLFGRNKN